MVREEQLSIPWDAGEGAGALEGIICGLKWCLCGADIGANETWVDTNLAAKTM